jgi:hypothetical protein
MKFVNLVRQVRKLAKPSRVTTGDKFRLNELLSVVQLYRALGGGWQTENQLTQK